MSTRRRDAALDDRDESLTDQDSPESDPDGDPAEGDAPAGEDDASDGDADAPPEDEPPPGEDPDAPRLPPEVVRALRSKWPPSAEAALYRWMQTVTDRPIADFLRARNRLRRREVPMPRRAEAAGRAR